MNTNYTEEVTSMSKAGNRSQVPKKSGNTDDLFSGN